MKINGQEFEIKKLKTPSLESLLNYLSIKPETVAIDLNGDIIEKSSLGKIVLSQNDQIELIKFVGGG